MPHRFATWPFCSPDWRSWRWRSSWRPALARPAPTAEAARHVERIGARTVGRSIHLRLRRLPEHAGRLARALAVLEQSDLLQAARLAGLDESEAADAADLLAAAGIVEPGRPLSFIHPIVRSGIYAELSDAERAAAHRPVGIAARARNGRGYRRAHWLARAPAAGCGSGSGRSGSRRCRPGAVTCASPRRALRGGR